MLSDHCILSFAPFQSPEYSFKTAVLFVEYETLYLLLSRVFLSPFSLITVTLSTETRLTAKAEFLLYPETRPLSPTNGSLSMIVNPFIAAAEQFVTRSAYLTVSPCIP